MTWNKLQFLCNFGSITKVIIIVIIACFVLFTQTKFYMSFFGKLKAFLFTVSLASNCIDSLSRK